VFEPEFPLPNILKPGQSMPDPAHPSSYFALRSPNQRFTLELWDKSGLILVPTARPPLGQTFYPLWRSHAKPPSDGAPGDFAKRAVMEPSGEFVICDDGTEWWRTPASVPGSYVELQDDGNLVVYAPDRTPQWDTGALVGAYSTSFTPGKHGFHFANRFVNHLADIPGYGPIVTRGRCGGMSFAALDYYFAGMDIPGETGASFPPTGVPPDGHPLADFIYKRQIDSFAQLTSMKFVTWTNHSDHRTWFIAGVQEWTRQDESRASAGR
jgi:hypothetical protein